MTCRLGPAVPILFILALESLSAGIVFAQPRAGILTNLSLMDQLTRQAACEVVDSIGVRSGETITLVPAMSHEASEFVGEALASEFARRGVRARLALDISPSRDAGQQPGDAGGAGAPGNGAPHDQPSGQGPSGSTGAGSSIDNLGLGADADTSNADSLGFWGADTLKTDKNNSPAGPGAGGDQAGGPSGASTPPAGGSATSMSGASQGSASGASAVEESRRAPTVKPYPEGIVVEYRILEFGVMYPSLKRRFGVFGDPAVRRLGGVYLQASRIEGSDGTILGTVRGQSHYEDRLSARARSLAEGASYPFAKPVIPPASLTRLVEPLAVVAIVSSLVYLFYQNQN